MQKLSFGVIQELKVFRHEYNGILHYSFVNGKQYKYRSL